MDMTPGQIRQFEEKGGVMLNSPFTAEEIAAANRVFDGILTVDEVTAGSRATRFCDFYYPEILHLLQHPFLEETAKALLRTEDVVVAFASITRTHPTPQNAFGVSEHVDDRYTLSDWNATPRRISLPLFIWLTDVTMDRAPLSFRPGSHLQMAEYFEEHPELVDDRPMRGPDLPTIPMSDYEYACARAGQVLAVTTGAVHGASANTGNLERRKLTVIFRAMSESLRINEDALDRTDVAHFFDQLSKRLRPERRHLVPALETLTAT